MPFRPEFDCLWCGRRHAVRGPADIEGYAQLCPDCLGRAGTNGFLRARLHAALAERAAAARGAAHSPDAPGRADPAAPPAPGTGPVEAGGRSDA